VPSIAVAVTYRFYRLLLFCARHGPRASAAAMADRVAAPSGTVIALGVVSLLADVASEMVYPLLPLYLTTVLGASALSLGIIEGVADSTASVLKLVSGVWSDRAFPPPRRRRLLAVRAARPLIALATAGPPCRPAFRRPRRRGAHLSARRAHRGHRRAGPAGRAYGLHRGMVAAARRPRPAPGLPAHAHPGGGRGGGPRHAVREPRATVVPSSTPLLAGWGGSTARSPGC
jgi:hypothetical protein